MIKQIIRNFSVLLFISIIQPTGLFTINIINTESVNDKKTDESNLPAIEITGNFITPEDACNSYKALYSELKEFEEDLHKHIHLENNILFPKAIESEEDLFSL